MQLGVWPLRPQACHATSIRPWPNRYVREALWNSVDGPPRGYARAAGLLEVSFLWRTVKHVLLSPISRSGDQLPSLKIVSTPFCIAYSASVTQVTQALVI